MEQITKQLSDVVAIKTSKTLREVLIQVDGEWNKDFLMNDYRSGIRISQRFDYDPETKEDIWHQPLVHVSYNGTNLSALPIKIELANSILADIDKFWKDVLAGWLNPYASRSQPRKQMRSEVQFFLDKFFLPSFAYLPNKSEGDRMGLLALEAKPRALGINNVSDDALTVIVLNFDGEKLSVCTKIFDRVIDISLPIDCSLGELKGAIRSQVDSILERLAEDVREGVENFSGEETDEEKI